jgi:hypothetical protein
VQVLVLDQPGNWIHGSISKLGDLLKRHDETEFFCKSPACRRERRLSRAWVTAA